MIIQRTPTARVAGRRSGFGSLLRFAIAMLAVATASSAIEEDDLLLADDAFAVSATAASGHVQVSWTIADGYYMYKERISFRSLTPGIELGPARLPAGEEKEDEFFGLQETYRNRVTAEIPLVRTDPALATLEIEARSQGCADLGVCYPPHRQNLTLQLASSQPASASLSDLLGSSNPGTSPFAATPTLGLTDDALPVDEAFVFETIAISPTELLARWTIAEGYYIYRDKIRFEADGELVILGDPALPDGVPMTDEHFGDVEVYFGQVEIPLAVQRTRAEAAVLKLTGHYQGCKEAGICYPPVSRVLDVPLPEYSGTLAVIPAAAADVPVPEQDRLARALDQNAFWTVLSFFGFGLLLAFTPCVFPMVPILSGIIAGQGDQITTRSAFMLSLVYVLAMALTYTIAGVIAGMFGENLQAAFQNAWVLGAFSLIFVLLALSMFGFYELQLPASWQNRLNQFSERQSGGTWAGTAIMGVLSALIVGPCVAPPLAAALIYIGQSGDALLGGAALFALSMGMGTPLLIVGTSAGRLLPRAGAWMETIKAVFGVGLLALAIWMLERIASPTLIMLLWGVLAVTSGVYMGAFERIPPERSGWFRLWKGLGLVLVIVGAAQLVGAAAGGKDWLQPLKSLGGGQPAAGPGEMVTFNPVKSLDQLQQNLASGGQPAMLDFYADWCVDCKRMERYTFPEPVVQAALSAGRVYKADVTANDDIDQELMAHFKIIGPPAILFFDASGQELPQYRVVGYQRPEPFADHVRQAFLAGASR